MKDKNKSNPSESRRSENIDSNKEGYPRYPKSEDIYEAFEEETEIDPADTSKTKKPGRSNIVRQESLDKKHKLTGKDLDVPGSSSDIQADTGSQDEENKYYSLGGDKHDD